MPYAGVETLAGTYHPHAIEVQEFSHYALMIDVRSREDYEHDHVPGAVQLDPGASTDASMAGSGAQALRFEVSEPGPVTQHPELPSAVAELVSSIKPDDPILVYCGLGGRLSEPLAKVLRWKGWTVDVLPGGWINYRRWVQAGLEVLPRLVTFRVVASSLGTEVTRVLNALRAVGHQVLDVAALARGQRAVPASCVQTKPSQPSEPSQAWFDSQLLHELRALDPAWPVWIGDTDPMIGRVALPGALVDALAIAPVARMQIPLTERVTRWREDVPELIRGDRGAPEFADDSDEESADTVNNRWKELAVGGVTDAALCSFLSDCLEPVHARRASRRSTQRHELPPLIAQSLDAEALSASVRAWMPVQRR